MEAQPRLQAHRSPIQKVLLQVPRQTWLQLCSWLRPGSAPWPLHAELVGRGLVASIDRYEEGMPLGASLIKCLMFASYLCTGRLGRLRQPNRAARRRLREQPVRGASACSSDPRLPRNWAGPAVGCIGETANSKHREHSTACDPLAAARCASKSMRISQVSLKTPQVKLLVEEGLADVWVRDRWGNTAHDEAKRVGARYVARYLKAKMDEMPEPDSAPQHQS